MMQTPSVMGLLLTILTDIGPNPTLNLSPLDELSQHKLSITGMTIFSLGLRDRKIKQHRSYKLLGPIPIPDSTEYDALCVFFDVEPDLGTTDDRVKEFGRDCTLWVIFNSKDRDMIIHQYTQIEKLVKQYLEPFTKESELDNTSPFKELLEKIQSLEIHQSSVKSSSTIFPPSNVQSISSGFFTLNDADNLIPIVDLEHIFENDIIIQVDLNNKIIYVIKEKNTISQKKVFLASRAASQYNLDKLKSEFQIRNIVDKIEVNFFTKKIQKILAESSEF